MKTVLMFPYANHLGGTQPLVAIALALREQGHRVVFAARGKCRAYVEECGFDVEDVLELDPDRSVAYINKSSLDYHTRESVAEFVAAERRLIEKYDADVVVDLHRPTLKLSALLTHTPRAVLCNTVLTRYYAGEKFLPESHPQPLKQLRVCWTTRRPSRPRGLGHAPRRIRVHGWRLRPWQSYW